MRAVLVKDNVVVNAIEVGENYQPPDGHTLVKTEDGQIGDRFDGQKFHSTLIPGKDELIAHAWRRFDDSTFFPIKIGSDVLMIETQHRPLIDRLAKRAEDGKLTSGVSWPKGRREPDAVKLTAAKIIQLQQKIVDYDLQQLAVIAALSEGIRDGKVTKNSEIDNPPPGFPRWPPRFFEALK